MTVGTTAPTYWFLFSHKIWLLLAVFWTCAMWYQVPGWTHPMTSASCILNSCWGGSYWGPRFYLNVCSLNHEVLLHVHYLLTVSSGLCIKGHCYCLYTQLHWVLMEAVHPLMDGGHPPNFWWSLLVQIRILQCIFFQIFFTRILSRDIYIFFNTNTTTKLSLRKLIVAWASQKV